MKKLYTLPLIPLRGLTVFPNVVVHFDVGREKSTAAIEKAMESGQEIFLVGQKNSIVEEPNQDEIYSIGTICKIKQILKMSDNTIRVLVEGQARAQIVEYIEDEEDYIKVSIEKLGNVVGKSEELDAYIKYLDKEFLKLLKLNEENYGEFIKVVNSSEKPSDFIDIVASYAITDEGLKQEVLEILDLKKRAEKVLERIKVEISIAKIQRKIANKVKNTVSKEQKEYYLREQMKAIQEELGEDDEEKKEIAKYEEKFEKAKLSKEVKEKVIYELSRLKNMSPTSSEGNVIKAYLDWILDIPWAKFTIQQ
jgi:ATP-dependent Lon protease